MSTRVTPEGVAAFALAALSVLMVVLDVPAGPVRGLIVLTFVLVGPGLALLHAVGRCEPIEAIVLVVAWSLSSAVTVSLLVLATGSRATGTFVYGLVLETLVLLAIGMWNGGDPEVDGDEHAAGDDPPEARRRARA